MQTKNPTPVKSYYSESFKIKVVREYERGNYTKDELKQKYKIGGNSVVLEWLRKYGKLNYSKTSIIGRRMKDPQKQKIKELEAQLKEARNKLMVYEKVFEINKRETGEDVLKNIVTKLSLSWPSGEKK